MIVDARSSPPPVSISFPRRRFPHLLHHQQLAASCSLLPLFSPLRPLFSMLCNLFGQNRGCGYTPQCGAGFKVTPKHVSFGSCSGRGPSRAPFSPRRSCKVEQVLRSIPRSKRSEEKVPSGINQCMDQSGCENRIAFAPRPAVKKTRNRGEDHIAPVGKS